MDSKFQLSETEKQIVEFLWGHGGEAETKDIYSHFKEQKEESSGELEKAVWSDLSSDRSNRIPGSSHVI